MLVLENIVAPIIARGGKLHARNGEVVVTLRDGDALSQDETAAIRKRKAALLAVLGQPWVVGFVAQDGTPVAKVANPPDLRELCIELAKRLKWQRLSPVKGSPGSEQAWRAFAENCPLNHLAVALDKLEDAIIAQRQKGAA
jgi:hypothetical protein